jgi:UPF0755 protein
MSPRAVRPLLARAFLLVGVPLLVAAIGARVAWHDLHAPYAAFPPPGVTLEVRPGAGGGEIARSLEAAGVVPSALLFRAYVRAAGLGGSLQAGEYRFERAASPVEVARKLARGEVLLHRVTLPEGLTVEETARVLSGAGYWEEAEVREALAHPEWIQDLDPEAPDLEGYLFPDTYAFPRGVPAGRVVRSMLERFREVCGEEERLRSAELGLTVRQAVTLASLVEREARLPAERPVVSSVIHNRLGRGMKLEIDPTVIYALRRAGLPAVPLKRSDLRHDDPYNTYLHPGLPPGPICSPGSAALTAALHPARTDYLYFVVDPGREGAHYFSRTHSEHLRAVRRYRQRER